MNISRTHPARSHSGRTLVLLLLVAIGGLAALLVFRFSHPALPALSPPVPASPPVARLEPTVQPAVPPVAEAEPEPVPAPAAMEPALAAAPVAASPGPAAASAPKPQKQKEPIQDEIARAALAFVGFDPEAEAYWYEAINDRSLSGHERQDLIEDLNEEGFADPRRPAAEELPLILSRLALIEEVAGFAMDKVNEDAFAEAYKDLVNMRDRLLAR